MKRHTTTHTLLLLLGVAGALLASGAGRAAEELVVNAILPLTGPGAFLGQEEQATMQLGEKLVNAKGGIRGKVLRFVFHDDQSKPQVAVQLLQEVLAQKPAVVIGSAIVANCSAMMPLMAQGPVQYCLSPTIKPEPGSYVFTSNISTDDQNRAIIRYFRLRGLKRIGLIVATDAMGQLAEQSIEQVLKLPENKEMVLVHKAEFNPADVSVAAQIERLKAAAPDALLAWNTGTPIATVFKGLIQGGLDLPVATNYGNMTYAQMKAYAAFLPKQLYFPTPGWLPHPDSVNLGAPVEAAQKDFFAQFSAAGVSPDIAHIMAWDPMMILVDALRAVGPDASPVALRDHILHLKSYAGIDGVYDFETVPQRGLSDANVVVARWDGDRTRWEVVSRPTGIPLER